MIIKASLNILASALLLAGPNTATSASGPDALFVDNNVIDAKISAPFGQIMKERPDEEQLDGKFEFVDNAGGAVELDVAIRTRGKYRRRKDICPFAPLRLNFKKGQLENTIFDKQDKLKLVTHCKNDSDTYQRAVLKEYLAYRILNVMTDTSYQVKLLRITYVYTDDDIVEPSYAILIEDKDRLASRLGMQLPEVAGLSVKDLHPEYMNLTSVFHYLIGNLDFSPVKGPSDDVCCHNHTPLSVDNSVYWSVPYDFDLAGLVAAPHAVPNPRFKQRTVRQRVYRGRCVNNDKLPATLQQFRDKRTDIEKLVAEQISLGTRTRKSLDSYIEDFYKRLDKEDRLLKRFAKACI